MSTFLWVIFPYICLAVFVVGLLAGQVELRLRFANVAGPLLIAPGQLAGVADGEYYRLVTAAFLHAGLLHLAAVAAAWETCSAASSAAGAAAAAAWPVGRRGARSGCCCPRSRRC